MITIFLVFHRKIFVSRIRNYYSPTTLDIIYLHQAGTLKFKKKQQKKTKKKRKKNVDYTEGKTLSKNFFSMCYVNKYAAHYIKMKLVQLDTIGYIGMLGVREESPPTQDQY